VPIICRLLINSVQLTRRAFDVLKEMISRRWELGGETTSKHSWLPTFYNRTERVCGYDIPI